MNWHSKIKKYGYKVKVKERLYGQSSDGRKVFNKTETGLQVHVAKMTSRDSPSVKLTVTSLACKVSRNNQFWQMASA